MIRYKFFCYTDNQGSEVSEIYEYNEHVEESEVEQDFKEWFNGVCDRGWYELNESEE